VKHVETSRGKKNLADRYGLAEALGVGLTTVDKLIARGLKPSGTRGKAHVYSVVAAQRLAARLAPRPSAEPNVLIEDYRSHAEDLHARREALRAEHVAVRDVSAAWRRVVGFVERATREWPEMIRARVKATHSTDELHALLAADGARPEPPPPRRHFTPAELLALLDADAAAWPERWRRPDSCAVDTIRRRALDRGLGIEVDEAGAWSPWRPADGLPTPKTYPAPVLRDTLEAFADAFVASDEMRGLAEVLDPPEPAPVPAPPKSVAEARAAWRSARATHRREAVRVRRGHVKRLAVRDAIMRAIEESKWRFWRWQPAVIGVSADALRASLDRWRVDALAPLALLFTPRGGPDATTTETETTPAPPASVSGATRRAARRSRSSSTTTNAQKPMPPRPRRRPRR
jgi:hypothetical protein